jgi:hypothetical protein
MGRKPRMVYMVCVPPPNISDPIEAWTRHLARYRPFMVDQRAKREVRHASAVIEWKLGGELGPAPKKEIPSIPLAPKSRGIMPT